MDAAHYYRDLAVAYARGMRPDLACLAEDEMLDQARADGLRFHRFKRTAGLPRVRQVLGALKGFAPATLLDVGSGRGAFLWPLLDEFESLEVTAIDQLEHRVADINAVSAGGISRVSAKLVSAEDLPWPSDSFDAVTVLEVLEHVADPAPVARELVRVAREVVIATVPAKPDNNPEHIRLFTPDSLRDLFLENGCESAKTSHVLNHIVCIAKP